MSSGYPGPGDGYGPPPYHLPPQQYSGQPPYQQAGSHTQQPAWNHPPSSYNMNGYPNTSYSQPPSATPPTPQHPSLLPAPQSSNHQQPQFISPAELLQSAPVQSRNLQNFSSNSGSYGSVLPALTNSTMAPIRSASPHVDVSMLLISLAEEYFAAAHKLAPTVALTMADADVRSYGGLITTGLGCLETALKKVKLAPRMEAKVRLRYAGVLLEETENSEDAEACIGKGIALCERNHYFDLKNALQFLQARDLGNTNPKASMKALDSFISEAETYKQFSWVYAFRFLRASQALRTGTHLDINTAIVNLRTIANLAQEQQDFAIHLMASLMEVMAHMRSSATDAGENMRAAIAKAWSNQLNVGNKLPQLIGLAHILQVACTIRKGHPPDMVSSLVEMQKMMDETLRNPTWSSSGDVVKLPINRAPKTSNVSQDTRMILTIGDDGRDNLIMSFLSMKDAFTLTYLMCGVVFLHKNSQDQKAFKFLEDGTERLKNGLRKPSTTSSILPDLVQTNSWRREILCYFQIYLAFGAAAIGDWPRTNRYIQELKSSVKDFDLPLHGTLGSLMLYIMGIYHQGIGDFDTALDIYKKEEFDLSKVSGTSLNSLEQVHRDVTLLASLNTISILQEKDRRDLVLNQTLLAKMEPLCTAHPVEDIRTAYNLLVVTVKTPSELPVFEVKNHLRAAMTGAQHTLNTQFTCISLNVMCDRFFTGVVGNQAEKSAQVAAVQAARTGNPLWRSVSEGKLGECYEVQGKMEEAQEKLHLAKSLLDQALPGI